jgi:hypothetical protein
MKLLKDANLLKLTQRNHFDLTYKVEVHVPDGPALRFWADRYSSGIKMLKVNEFEQPLGCVSSFDLTRDGEDKLRRLLEEIKKQLPDPAKRPPKKKRA